MKKFRTVASVIIMVIAGIVGFFIGAFLNEPMAGTILFSIIAGIACIVYAIDNHEEQGKFLFANLPFERGKILFSKGFSVYTDIRKLQDKAKTSYTLSTRRLRFGYE